MTFHRLEGNEGASHVDMWGECLKSTLETRAKVLLRMWTSVFREEQRSQSGWNGESEWGKYWMRSESVQEQKSCRIFQNYRTVFCLVI